MTDFDPTQGFKPEVATGAAGNIGTEAVKAAGVVNGADTYDHLFDDSYDAQPATSQTSAGLSEAEAALNRQQVEKNMNLVQQYGPTFTGTPPTSQYFNVPPKQ